MTNKINNFMLSRIPPVGPSPTTQPRPIQNPGTSFQDILNQKLNQSAELKISKHAEQRMKDRNINFSKDQMDRINQAVSKAEQKGVKESLIMVDDIAVVASIKNKTIITVVGSNELKDNVFTNIDGAVVI